MKCDTIADLERFLQIQEQAMGPMSAEVATTASKLADLYLKSAKLERAESLYRRALHIRQNLNGFHRNEVCESEDSLRRLLDAKEAANKPLTNPFARQYPTSEARQTVVADALAGTAIKNNAASVQNAMPNATSHTTSNATSNASMSNAYVSNSRGSTGGDTTTSSDSISPVSIADNRQRVTSPNLMQDAIKEAEVELDLLKQMVGQEHSTVADMLTKLADLYCRLRLYSKMEPILVEALRIREACCGADHLSVSTELKNLARLYLAQERYAIAEPLFKRALIIRERVLGRDHGRVADIEEQYAHLLRKTNRLQQADLLDKHVEKVRAHNEDCLQPKQTNSIIFKSI